jgi:hypothetical protein
MPSIGADETHAAALSSSSGERSELTEMDTHSPAADRSATVSSAASTTVGAPRILEANALSPTAMDVTEAAPISPAAACAHLAATPPISLSPRIMPTRGCRVAANAMCVERAVTLLLPLAGDERQVYLPNAAAGLQRNCELLGFRVADVPLIGKALMALRAFDAGAVVGCMWGKLMSRDAYNTLATPPLHVDPTRVEGEEDYSAPMKQRSVRGVDTGGPDEVVLASEQCPMSLINHSHQPAERNVSIDLTATAFGTATQGLPQQDYWTIFKICATMPIQPGELLCADYGWSDAAWAFVSKQPAACGSGAAAAAVEETANLLQRWHRRTVALLSRWAPKALWSAIHRDRLRDAATAESLLIAMGAVQGWSFYHGQVRVTSSPRARALC